MNRNRDDSVRLKLSTQRVNRTGGRPGLVLARVVLSAAARGAAVQFLRVAQIRAQSEKFQVESEYGMRPDYYGYSIEIDHIVPLELGGSNNIANLSPEPGSGAANYHVKDELENRLHDLVCAESMSLRTAQVGIATNWQVLYRNVFGDAP
jgi:hypothetical protein